jgi:hypothetical protein
MSTPPRGPVFTSLWFALTAASVPIAGTAQLIATPLDQNGSPISGLGASTWSSSEQAKATVDETGKVIGGIAERERAAHLSAGGRLRLRAHHEREDRT